jgi:transketolase
MSKTKDLQMMANKLRIGSLKSTTSAGSGHPTSCLSCAEIMSCLFFSELRPDDEFVMSKGHAAPILYAAYSEAGCFPEDELLTLRRLESVLEGHPTPRFRLVKVATGSLGQGLSAAVGMALAKRLKGQSGRVYVLLGDGECAEGSVWEAANAAAHYEVTNICAIVDVNRLGQSAPTMHGHDLEQYRRKFEAFGWRAETIDGHNVEEILPALDHARGSEKPFVIIAKTIKGKGVSFLEDREGWHGKALKDDQLGKALKEIGSVDIKLVSKACKDRRIDYRVVPDFQPGKYAVGEPVSTRAAFGNALVSLGKENETVVVLDGDVKNSTMTEGFFKALPERAFESYIAEQNMVGMAVGLSAMGLSPFVATFSCFLTRAHDFIRMARYSLANIKFCGSHAGISIGQDGPSQMGLEDIPMFLNIPDALVLYPCDAPSTEHLVREMARYQGISYLRTTRNDTPVIYDNEEEFPVGGLKVVRGSDADEALIVAAGITVHEAIRAHDVLKQKGTSVRVIDLYSLHPVDAKALMDNAARCGNKVVTVEDHYCRALGSVVGGILGRVKSLCVREIPSSGRPEELLRRHGIDSSSIVEAVDEALRSGEA